MHALDLGANRSIFSKLAASIDDRISVQAFGDPQVALDWVRDNTPDLVVTDYKMPHMDGAEFIRRFRELPGAAEIPVIVLTISGDDRDIAACRQLGVENYIVKPVGFKNFVEAMPQISLAWALLRQSEEEAS